MVISATLNGFTAYGTSWRPKRCSRFFFFAINVHGNTRYSKNGIPDQTDGINTLFQTKMAKSIPYFRLEMLEAAHTYMAYIWEYPLGVWYGMAWHGTVWYGMVWYGTVWYGIVWYDMLQYIIVWYGMVWYGMVRYGTGQYGMVWYGMVWFGLMVGWFCWCV